MKLDLTAGLLFAIGLLASALAAAAAWEPVTDTETSIYLIDRSSLVPVDGKLSGWVLVTGPNGMGLPNYGSRTQLMVFDCEARAVALKAYELHSQPGGQGTVLRTEAYDDAQIEFTKTAPDTVGEKLLEAACGQ